MATNTDALAEDLSRLEIAQHSSVSDVPERVGKLKESLRLRRYGTKARDITKEFSEAAQALRTGELVKDDWFRLFESVGALEMMDPKLDSGYVAPGEPVEDNYDFATSLTIEEIVGLMDQLLCLEIAWQMGHPLSQTLFTSLYLMKLLDPEPKTLADAQFLRQDDDRIVRDGLVHVVLRAYCLALIKCCDFVHKRIGVEYCREDEDFVTHLYNRSLLSEMKEQEITCAIDEAVLWSENMEASVSTETQSALLHRLRFRRSLLIALANDNNSEKETPIRLWNECADLIPCVEKTNLLGRAVPQAFSVKIQRKLDSILPPRPMVHVSFEETLSHLKRLCRDANDVWHVLGDWRCSEIMTFCWTIQLRKPQPSAYIRALLQCLLYEETKIPRRRTIRDVVLDELAETVLPADVLLDKKTFEVEAVQDPRFQMAKKMNDFLIKARECYIDLYRCICQNRSRTRRMLCHSIFDWDTLQLDAEEIDDELRKYTGEEPVVIDNPDGAISEQTFAYPLSSWVYYHKLRQMECIVLLGFELDVYQPDELAGMYGYLRYLCDTRICHLERMRGCVTRKLKSITRLNDHEGDAFTRCLSFLEFSLLEATACLEFAGGLSWLYTALMRLSLIPVPPRPYSNESLRYEVRMKPFLPLSIPAVLPFNDFKRQIELSYLSTPDLLKHSNQALLRARKHLELLRRSSSSSSSSSSSDATTTTTTPSRMCHDEWSTNIKNITRAAIATGIVVSTLERKLDDLLLAEPAVFEAEEQDGTRDETNKEEGEGMTKLTKKKKRVTLRVVRTYHDYWLVPDLAPLLS